MLRGLLRFSLVTVVLGAISGSAPALASAASLQAAAQAFAGAPVYLDERIFVPECPNGYRFAWLSSAANQLEAQCPGSDWRMRLPIAPRQSAAPRRGEVLRVDMHGSGYRVSADAVVESVNPRDGTLLLRNLRSGTRFTGHLQADGTVVAGRAER